MDLSHFPYLQGNQEANAGHIFAGPLAKIPVPGRIPNGFHASWMQSLKLEAEQ